MIDWASIGIDKETEEWMFDILCQARDKGHGSPSFKYVFKNHKLMDIVLNNEERRRMTEERIHVINEDGLGKQ